MHHDVTRPILLRLPQVRSETGCSRSTVYERIKQGLLSPAIRLGPNSVAWPASEIAAINAARISGKSDLEIRELVAALVSSRTAGA